MNTHKGKCRHGFVLLLAAFIQGCINNPPYPSSWPQAVASATDCPDISGIYSCNTRDIEAVFSVKTSDDGIDRGEYARTAFVRILSGDRIGHYTFKAYPSADYPCHLFIEQKGCNSIRFTVSEIGSNPAEITVPIDDYNELAIDLDEDDFGPRAKQDAIGVLDYNNTTLSLYQTGEKQLAVKRSNTTAGISIYPIPFIPLFYVNAHWLLLPKKNDFPDLGEIADYNRLLQTFDEQQEP